MNVLWAQEIYTELGKSKLCTNDDEKGLFLGKNVTTNVA